MTSFPLIIRLRIRMLSGAGGCLCNLGTRAKHVLLRWSRHKEAELRPSSSTIHHQTTHSFKQRSYQRSFNQPKCTVFSRKPSSSPPSVWPLLHLSPCLRAECQISPDLQVVVQLALHRARAWEHRNLEADRALVADRAPAAAAVHWFPRWQAPPTTFLVPIKL
ncbi:uncharacterized protein MYCGRDRAFT_108844 [Zymoseptoria tritici IPO323]|uniref:Uncharacterized protein n=1 Tax=Zymoseptoria tritici (strain CBS 115943 / IPO323) TaxID=336722 RepID=F9X6I1_ZYMTI|nr:uncharacterized protein MYCGRDRAFT_108844 [Zymoseptoria tritici IPO323]EGP89193.1 hypothetical protein MYCGRDRAFT_108844 [Zymoseptoria tritici IPO323]